MNAAYKSEAGRAAVAAAYGEVLAHWPVPCEQIRVPTREGETFVIACGPGDAPPVVLCHGAQANAASWMLEVATWASKFRLYAVDMIGEAGLSAPSRPPLDGEAHALWLDDVLSGLGVERAAFVGVSLGGWLTLDYAVRRPDRARALALNAPAGVGRQLNFLAKAWPLLLLGPWGRRRLMRLVLGDAPAAVTPEQARYGAFMALVMRHVRPRIVKIPQVTDAALRALQAPMLVLLGARDVLLDSADTRRRLEACRPDAEVVWLEAEGHFIRGQAERIAGFLEAAG